MFKFKKMFETLQLPFKSFEKSVEDFEKQFADLSFDEFNENEFDEELKDLEVHTAKAVVTDELRPDGTRIIKRVLVRTKTTPEVREQTPPAGAQVTTTSLEQLLWEQVYFRVQKFWPQSATFVSFDGKHYHIGRWEEDGLRWYGMGDSLEMAVREVEQRLGKPSQEQK